jgi:two-component system response regulator
VNAVLLVVEDNPTDAKLMRRAFAKWELTPVIIIAADGVEAIDYLHGPGCADRVIPRLVLLDLKLPRVDGLEVLRRIRCHERTRTLPVVILTSSREEDDLRESYALGANAYVRKPVDFADFVNAARTVGIFWLVLNEAPPVRQTIA